jgi:hypothetical protein
MSKHNNVNPDHYKIAGRERQGEDINHHLERGAMGRQKTEIERARAKGRTTKRRPR